MTNVTQSSCGAVDVCLLDYGTGSRTSTVLCLPYVHNGTSSWMNECPCLSLSVCIDDKLDRGAPPCVFDRQEKERLEKEQEIRDYFFSSPPVRLFFSILLGAEYVVSLFRVLPLRVREAFHSCAILLLMLMMMAATTTTMTSGRKYYGLTHLVLLEVYDGVGLTHRTSSEKK